MSALSRDSRLSVGVGAGKGRLTQGRDVPKRAVLRRGS